MKQITKMTGKEKKAQRRKNKEHLPMYWIKIRNKRTKCTKLVTPEKALNYLYGRKEIDGLRHKHLKDEYEQI
jgi:hypothetical protein